MLFVRCQWEGYVFHSKIKNNGVRKLRGYRQKKKKINTNSLPSKSFYCVTVKKTS